MLPAAPKNRLTNTTTPAPLTDVEDALDFVEAIEACGIRHWELDAIREWALAELKRIAKGTP